MNIGIVTTWFERGAAYVSKQYLDVLKEKHNVFIYARGGESYAKQDSEWDKNFVTWGKQVNNNIPTYIDIKDFSKWLKNNSIDVVFFNEQHCWEPVIHCCNEGVKTGAYVDYYTEHTVPFFKLYDFLICNTKRHFSAFEWHNQAYYVPWGTDISLFKQDEYKPVDNDRVIFFHSAGYNPERKGTDQLIKAFRSVKEPAKIIIHTQSKIEKFYPEIAPLMKSLQDSGRLELVEKTVAAPGLYHLGDVYVYPSRLDGIGLTMAEALACGLPVITSNNPPMSEFVCNESGKLVDLSKLFSRYDGYYWPMCEVNIESLASAMNYYVDNASKLQEFKQQARVYAENNLDWSSNSKALIPCFENSSVIPVDQKAETIKKAIVFEKNRAREKHKLIRIISNIFSKLGII